MSENKQHLDKNFALSTWAIENKITVYVVMFIIIFGGIGAFVSMPREAFPEIVENKVYISSVYPGTPAEDVEKLVSEPIEDEIRGISGIIDCKTTSYNDFALTVVEFDDNTNLEEAKIKIKDEVDQVKAQSDWPTLNTGAKVEPTVFDLNIAEEQPILNINLGGDFPLQELKGFGEELEDEIEALEEVKDVVIRGVDDKEVEVALDVYKMNAAQVSFLDVINAISADNTTISGGNVIQENHRTNLRVMGEVKDPAELKNYIVKNQGGSVRLGDISDVYFHEKDKTTYAREFGHVAVMLDVKKRSGANMIDAVDKIRAIVKKAQEKYIPPTVSVNLTNDQAPRTNNQVDDLVNNILFGVILVVGVLMFFLGLRNASFVGIAIPLSMLMAFIIVQQMGLTMNTMVLFAMVMGLGMLVDNGIVVVENVYTLVNKGMDPKTAAKQGVGEIAWPIIASTATTLAAFFPLGLWPGTMGKFMIYFPMTLSFVLGASLFVALFINSMLTSEFMVSEDAEKARQSSKKKMIKNTLIFGLLGVLFLVLGFVFDAGLLRALGNIFIFGVMFMWLYELLLYPLSSVFQERFLPWLEEKYQTFVTWALKNKTPGLLMISMIFLLISSFVLVNIAQPKTLFFPDGSPNQVFIYAEYPEGTDIERTNTMSKEIENRVIKVLKEYEVDDKEYGKNYNYMVESMVTQVGQGAINPQVESGNNSETPHKMKVTISLREHKYRRGVDSKKVLNEIRDAMKGLVGVQLSVEKEPVGPPSGYHINIQIAGEDYDGMMDEAEKMIDFIEAENIKGIEHLRVDVSRSIDELQIDVDEQFAGSMGVSNAMVGQTLRQSVYGWEASRYKPVGDDNDYPVNIRLMETQRNDYSTLFNQPITFRNPANGQLMQVPIQNIATMKPTKQFSKIKREDYNRVVTVYSNVLIEEGYNSNEVVQEIKKKLENTNYADKLPDGMTYKFTGEQEEQAKNMGFLVNALIYALLGIILIIVLQFNSVSKPLIIMTAVGLSFIGVLYGLVMSGSEFVIIMTMMGIISLAGIVVNNAIVLIDYTILLSNRKKEEVKMDEKIMLPLHTIKEVIIAGGKSRLRPVLLTATTTILGLLPLAIGLNIDFFGLFIDYNPNIYFGGDNVKFWGPLAWTVIYGLTFATFLTLVIVPVMQYLVHALKFRVRYGKGGYKYPRHDLLEKGDVLDALGNEEVIV